MANGGIIGPVNTVNAGGCAPASATTFTASGTFTAAATASVEYLVVAGGGGGDYASAPATYHGGAGGGAGGYRASGCFTPSPTRGSAVPVVGGAAYTITVGAGGAAGIKGVNSVFNYAGCATITSTGGGGANEPNPNKAGGSGGGAGKYLYGSKPETVLVIPLL